MSATLSGSVNLLSCKLIGTLFAQNWFYSSLRKPREAPRTLLASIINRCLPLFWHHRHFLNFQLFYLHFVVFDLAQKLSIFAFKFWAALLTFSNGASLFFNDLLITLCLLLQSLVFLAQYFMQVYPRLLISFHLLKYSGLFLFKHRNLLF